MRPLVSLLLLLVAFSASAGCISRVLLRANGPIYTAGMDDGVLYYSIFGERTIQRVDAATGQSSTFFTADDVLTVWAIHHGTIIIPSASGFLFIAPNGSRRMVATPPNARFVQLRDDYLYWVDESNDLRRVSVNGGTAERIAVALSVDQKFQYLIFEERLLFTNATGLYWQPFGGVPNLLLPRPDISGIDQV